MQQEMFLILQTDFFFPLGYLIFFWSNPKQMKQMKKNQNNWILLQSLILHKDRNVFIITCFFFKVTSLKCICCSVDCVVTCAVQLTVLSHMLFSWLCCHMCCWVDCVVTCAVQLTVLSHVLFSWLCCHMCCSVDCVVTCAVQLTVTCVGQIETPVLIMIGKDDRRVPPSQGYELYKALKARNKPVK